MCRLLAQISKKPQKIDYWFFDAKIPLIDFSRKKINGGPHNSGWGIGSFNNNSWKIFKEGKEDVNSYSFNKIKSNKSKIILLHLRHASVGNESTKNAHPFSYKKWIFEHNGGVERASLLKYLNKKYFKELKSETDSEAYFLLIMQFLEKTKDILQAIKETLKIVKQYKYRGLNFILSDGQSLYVYRDVSPKLSKKDRNQYYVLHYLKKANETVFSSDPLDNQDWKALDYGDLIIINKNLELKKIKV